MGISFLVQRSFLCINAELPAGPALPLKSNRLPNHQLTEEVIYRWFYRIKGLKHAVSCRTREGGCLLHCVISSLKR